MYAIQIDIESMHQFSLFRDHDDNEVCLPEKQGATKQFDSGGIESSDSSDWDH